MRRLGLLVSVSLVAFACSSTTALALPGDLDTTFGDGGRVITDFGGTQSAIDSALQPDGKIVAVGTFSGQFDVARYNPDGSLDSSFSGDGLVRTGFGADEGAQGVAIQPDGKIVVAGFTTAGPGPQNLALVRYNADGSPDNGFDGNGSLFTDLGASERATGVAIQPDGGIVVAVAPAAGAPPPHDFIVVRYLSTGMPDGGFGAGGVATTDMGGSDRANDVALQPDGRIILAGSSDAANISDFAIARYLPNGSPDADFDGDGFRLVDFGDGDLAVGLALQPDGKIVASGISQGPGTGDAAVARLNADGSPDPSFGGGDALVLIDFGTGSDEASDLALQPDGKIVIDSGNRFSVARLTAAGALDTAFGIAGRAETDFGGFNSINSVLVQADGRIVGVGTTNVGPNPSNFALARFEGGEPPPAPPPPPGNGGTPTCRGKVATIVASPGAVTPGTTAADVIVGTDGPDRIKSGKGRDRVCALTGKDRVAVGAGNDFAAGGKGRDFLRGGAGRDLLRGNAGNDTLIGGGSRDKLAGGKGNRDQCTTTPGRDRATGC